MSQHLQLVLLAVTDELVGHAEVEDAFGGSQRLGLHAVLGYGAVEVLVDDGITLGHLAVTLPLVNGSTYEAVLANGVLQALLGHRCQRHHGQTKEKQFLTHGVLQSPC